jgi:hypothetical protein
MHQEAGPAWRTDSAIMPQGEWEFKNKDTDEERVAWAARAPELARWAWARLVNRADVWGGYVPEADRGKEYTRADGRVEHLGKTLTRPAVRNRGKVLLTPAHLERHFRPRGAGDVVGLHTTSAANTSLWGAVELDRHGEQGNSPEANLAASLAWYARLWELGFRSLLLTDSNGAGGYHLRVLFREPVPTPKVFALLRRLTHDHARHGISHQPECFPKQPKLEPTPDGRGACGNWLRLPGRHHTWEHWSRAWDGSRWLAGAPAVEFVLALAGDPAELVPQVPVAPAPIRSPLVGTAGVARRSAEGGNLSDRIAAYCRKLPHLAEGQGRDDVAFGFAAWLVNDVAVTDDIALAWLERWDSGNSPPKGLERLKEVLANAHRYARGSSRSSRSQERPRVEVRPTGRPGHSIIVCRSEVF